MPTAFLIQNILAILTIGGLFLFRSSTRPIAIASIAAAWVLMLGVALAGFWYYPPPIGMWIYLALLFGASVRHLRRLHGKQNLFIKRFRVLTSLASAGLGSLLLWQAVAGRFPVDVEHIDISSPLETGVGHCVLSGGSSVVNNFHYRLRHDPADRYEMHAIDFTRTNTLGIRTTSFDLFNSQPKDPEAYLIYDSAVVAPCAGTVVEAASDKPDHLAGNQYRDTSGVNYVVLQCDSTLVTLGHLRENSVDVEVGQEVVPGTLLGRVGNSGNSEEPHLHLHANTIANEQGFRDPVPIRITGRYLSRDDCL